RVALALTCWVVGGGESNLGSNIVLTRVVALTIGGFRALSRLSLASVPDVRSANSLKSWIFWTSIRISSWSGFVSLSYISSFHSDLATLPRVAYCKNLSLKSKNDSFGCIRSSWYAYHASALS